MVVVLCRGSGSEKWRRNVKGEVVRDTESVSYDREAGQLGFKGRLSRGSKRGTRATGTTCLIGLWCEYLISEIMFPAYKLRVPNIIVWIRMSGSLSRGFLLQRVDFGCHESVPGRFGGHIYSRSPKIYCSVFQDQLAWVQLQVDIFRFCGIHFWRWLAFCLKKERKRNEHPHEVLIIVMQACGSLHENK